MKTNHRRDFKDTRRSFGHRQHPGVSQVSMSGKLIAAGWNPVDYDYTNGIHGYAKSRRGAKKFVHSRIRRDTRDTLKKLELGQGEES